MAAHRPSLDLDALRVLTLVADLGSISAAARAEQISQPSASTRIQGLERRLGLELLDRRTGRVTRPVVLIWSVEGTSAG